jgi:hypothetical protein
MHFRVSLVLAVAATAAFFSPAANAAIPDFDAPFTAPQGWSNAPARDIGLAFATTTDPAPDVFTARSSGPGNNYVQIRQTNTLGEYRQTFYPGYGYSVQDDTPPGEPFGLDLGDVTLDASPDILVATSNGIGLAKGAVSGSYGAFSTPSGSSGIAYSAVKLANMNGDVVPDLVATRTNGFDVFINTLNPTTPFATASGYGFITGAKGLAVADFDGDNIKDVATTLPTDQRVYALIANNVANPLLEGRSIGLYTRPGAITTANVTGDAKPEIIVTEPDRGTVAVISTTSLPTSLGPITRIPTGLGPVDVEVADLDGDGVNEIITANAGSDSVTVADVGGASKSFPAGPSPNALAVGKMNADDRPDLLVANDGVFAVSRLVNQGVPTPAQPLPIPVIRTASLKCSAKKTKKKVREVSCTVALSRKADAKSLSATLNLGKKKLKTVRAAPGKKLSFKFADGLKVGSYSVKLTVTNTDGTKLTATKSVKVK